MYGKDLKGNFLLSAGKRGLIWILFAILLLSFSAYSSWSLSTQLKSALELCKGKQKSISFSFLASPSSLDFEIGNCERHKQKSSVVEENILFEQAKKVESLTAAECAPFLCLSKCQYAFAFFCWFTFNERGIQFSNSSFCWSKKCFFAFSFWRCRECLAPEYIQKLMWYY